MDLQGKPEGKRSGEVGEHPTLQTREKCRDRRRTSPLQSASEIWTDSSAPSWFPCRCRRRRLKGRSEGEKDFQNKSV